MTATLDTLRHHAASFARRAFVPYSHKPAATVVLLSDGTWVPGVRVESASFSLTIPSALNALTTAAAMGHTDVVAAVHTGAFDAWDRAFLESLPTGELVTYTPDAFVRPGMDLPAVSAPLGPGLDAPVPQTPADGIQLARTVAERAVVPSSQFPVGCVLVLADGTLVPGVNVEHPDWARILCAERTAVGTVVSYGLPGVERAYLTCIKDETGTPCGACRQVLVEHAPDAELWMDRGTAPPERTSPAALLPGGFTGRALTRDR